MSTSPEPQEEGSIKIMGFGTSHPETRGGLADITSKSDNVKAAEGIQSPGELNQDTPEQKTTARNYRWRLIIGLLLPSILEALDTTIIAAALSFIASEFSTLFNFDS